MKIGILVPLSQELSPLTSEKISKGNCINITDSILVIHTGIGPDNTLRSVNQLLALGVDHLISWGTAAGLSPSVAAGDLMMPDAVMVSKEKFATNHEFNNRVLKQISPGLRWHKGLCYATKELLDSVESKQEIFATTRCIGADMESGAVAKAATENNIPFTVIRSVSDPVYMPLPKAVAKGFNQEGDLMIKDLAKLVISSPGDWTATFKLARNFKKARKTLNIVAKVLKDQTWT